MNVRDDTAAILHGGTVWMGSRPEPRGDWMVIVGDRVTDVGTGPAPVVESATHIDLAGGHVLPGLVDIHSHLTVAAWSAVALDASPWRTSGDALAAVRRRAATLPEDAWVLGTGLDLDVWSGPTPTAEALAEASGGRPVLVADVTLHRGLASPAAMDRGGVLSPGAVPPHDVSRHRGRPTGRVWEAALGRCWRRAVSDLAAAGVDLDALVSAEAQRHLDLGLVRIHEPGIGVDGADALARCPIPLRRSWSPSLAGQVVGEPGEPGGDAPASTKVWLDAAHRCAVRAPAAMVVRAGIFGLVDGMRRRDRAAVLEMLGSPVQIDDRPRVLLDHRRATDGELMAALEDATEDGHRLRLHALGNAAVVQATTVAQRLGFPPLVVEHAVVGDPAACAALAAAGAFVATQPAFVDGFGRLLRGQGVERHLIALPLRSLRDAGAGLVISSDHPCGDLDPLRIIRTAVERRDVVGRVLDANEALDLDAAIAAMTVDAHAALGRTPTDIDPHPGQIVDGALADLTELDGPPLDPTTKVRRTWVGGEVAAEPHGPTTQDVPWS